MNFYISDRNFNKKIFEILNENFSSKNENLVIYWISKDFKKRNKFLSKFNNVKVETVNQIDNFLLNQITSQTNFNFYENKKSKGSIYYLIVLTFEPLKPMQITFSNHFIKMMFNEKKKLILLQFKTNFYIIKIQMLNLLKDI